MTAEAGGTRPDDTFRVEVADGVDLHVVRWHGGDRTPFVLVHGLASNARLWDGVAVELAGAGHPVVAVDQRGHGRAAKPDHGYDMGTITDDLRALIEATGFDRPVLAGQSWGGNVVVEFAARFTGVARAVACVDGGTIELAAQFPDWEACAEALKPPPLVGTPADELERMLRRMHPDWPESGIAGTMACFEVRGDGTIAPWLTLDRHLLVLRGLWEHRPTQRFPHIVDPVLFLAADSPDADPEWRAGKRRGLDQAAEHLADVRVEWMAGDHDLHAQHPVQVADRLRALT